MLTQRTQEVIEQQVALAFFVPLIMGHGGNSGSQTVSTLIRALALRQVTNGGNSEDNCVLAIRWCGAWGLGITGLIWQSIIYFICWHRRCAILWMCTVYLSGGHKPLQMQRKPGG